VLCGTKEQALKGASSLVICTEWKAFKILNIEIVAAELIDKVMFDGRNLHFALKGETNPLRYYGIGLKVS
jgi:UDPglucose 6-dehydrogenase